MAYQGGTTPGNGYWPGGVTPNVLQQDGNPQQFRSPLQHHSSPNYQTQYWTSNHINHSPNGTTTNAHAQHPPAPPQQQFQQPQFIAPAQLLQSSSSSPSRTSQFQRTPSLSRKPSNLSMRNSSSVESSYHVSPGPNIAMLLVSLAEEYFEEAHKLAPAVARSMKETYVAAYEQLIATGLGCLDTALKREKLTPRLEANIRLRYAGVLLEETENTMEAETTLTHGIALCERNHYYDLKYAMQFLLSRFTAKKNVKAAMKALDGHIADAQAFQHYPWVYAFRFLRASFASASSSASDNKSAIQNLQAIASLAGSLGDRAIHLTAALMEAMVHMRSSGPEALEQMQRAIAAAWAHQMDLECRIPQLQCLIRMVDVVCSIRQGQPGLMREKLKNMRDSMDEFNRSRSWSSSSNVLAIPIRRTPKSSHVVSQDTRMVLGIGIDGGDNLMMTFLNRGDATAISYLLAGIVLHQGLTAPQRASALKYLQEGLRGLESGESMLEQSSPTSMLPDLLSQRSWRGQTICYTRIYLAFYYASVADWPQLGILLSELNKTMKSYEIPLESPPGCLILYLTGSYHQALGDLDTALRIFQDKRFDLSNFPIPCNTTYLNRIELDISILTALNTLWILQHPEFQNLAHNTFLIDKLTPFCEDHSNSDVKAAFNLVRATVETQPPVQLMYHKNFLDGAMRRAKMTQNYQILSITLSVICSSLFDHIIGPQAEKSAQAASIQSASSGNSLWMSVADGMLSKCYELQGKTAEAEAAMAVALKSSQKVLAGSEEV